MSKLPPIECIELAIDPRLEDSYLPLDPGRCAASYGGKGYSLVRLDDCGENNGEGRLSHEFFRCVEPAMTYVDGKKGLNRAQSQQLLT